MESRSKYRVKLHFGGSGVPDIDSGIFIEHLVQNTPY